MTQFVFGVLCVVYFLLFQTMLQWISFHRILARLSSQFLAMVLLSQGIFTFEILADNITYILDQHCMQILALICFVSLRYIKKNWSFCFALLEVEWKQLERWPCLDWFWVPHFKRDWYWLGTEKCSENMWWSINFV